MKITTQSLSPHIEVEIRANSGKVSQFPQVLQLAHRRGIVDQDGGLDGPSGSCLGNGVFQRRVESSDIKLRKVHYKRHELK